MDGFVFQARRPFSCDRLWRCMRAPWPPEVAIAGVFWTLNPHDLAGEWSCVEGMVTVRSAGPWLASLPRERWPAGDDAHDRFVDRVWREPWGDRRQDLVFTGSGIREEIVRARLQAALLDDVAWGRSQTIHSRELPESSGTPSRP